MNAIEARGIAVSFGRGAGRVRAVDGIDLELPVGTVLGLVGESGSGKSTLARACAGLTPIDSGTLRIAGEDMSVARRRRPQPMQMVFQDPSASLNPRIRVGETLAEAIAGRGSSGARAAQVGRLLEQVALDPETARRYPGDLSGGQRQRVAVARALACEPKVIIADEITSALDVSVQGSILNLIRDLHRRMGLTMLFISHNLATVRYVCDQVAVMKEGRIVESLPAEALVERASHPYTRALLAAVPELPLSGGLLRRSPVGDDR